ncbi:hypothetical protein D3C72_2267120 [compost metagenome]
MFFRQQVGAVAQGGATQCLEIAPDAQPHGVGLRGQRHDEGGPHGIEVYALNSEIVISISKIVITKDSLHAGCFW